MPDLPRHEQSEGGLIAARRVALSRDIPRLISQIIGK